LLFVSLQTASSAGVNTLAIGGMSAQTDRAWGVGCLNAANGQTLWLRPLGEAFGANFSGILDDAPQVSVSGTNVLLAGNAYGDSVIFTGLTVPLSDGRGQYLARYDTNGSPVTATVYGSPSTMIWASAANASGVYVCGDFDDYSEFGTKVIAAPLNNTNFLDWSINGFQFTYFTQPFIAKFDLNGNPLWARNGVSSDMANFRGLALVPDGVWASGFLLLSDISHPALFDTNSVYSDIYVPNMGGLVTIISTPGGLLAKIAETTSPAAVTVLNPRSDGTNFKFSFQSQSSFNYAILYRTNLIAGPGWQTNSSVAGDGTVKSVSIPLSIFSPSRQGFVRVAAQ